MKGPLVYIVIFDFVVIIMMAHTDAEGKQNCYYIRIAETKYLNIFKHVLRVCVCRYT